MGTSSVDRSPNLLSWSIVNTMYRDPNEAAIDILREVFIAGGSYAEGLGDEAVRIRVQLLLRAVDSDAWRSGVPGALEVARSAMTNAQVETVEAGVASFYGDLADQALHQALVGGARDHARLSDVGSALETFIRALLSTAIDHLVSRDITQHLGSRRLRRMSDVAALRQELVELADLVAVSADLSDRLVQPVAGVLDDWSNLIARAWRHGQLLASGMV